MLEANLEQARGHMFPFLGPEHSWHGGAAHWAPRLRKIADGLDGDWRRVSQGIAVLELVPYHSEVFKLGQTKSRQAGVGEAHARVCARGAGAGGEGGEMRIDHAARACTVGGQRIAEGKPRAEREAGRIERKPSDRDPTQIHRPMTAIHRAEGESCVQQRTFRFDCP